MYGIVYTITRIHRFKNQRTEMGVLTLINTHSTLLEKFLSLGPCAIGPYVTFCYKRYQELVGMWKKENTCAC